MVLVLAALTGTAFGTGVIVGLAVGASTLAGTYAYREARRVGGEERAQAAWSDGALRAVAAPGR
jgi:hypothetical protein